MAGWLLILGFLGLVGFPIELLLMSMFAPALGEVSFIAALNAYLGLAAVATPLGAWLAFFDWLTRRRLTSALKEAVKGTRLPRTRQRTDRPTYFLADSIDRELLVALQDSGGDVVEAEHQVNERALISEPGLFCRRVARLNALGLVSLSRGAERALLTAVGLDALGMPAALFVSHIPDGVFDYVRREKMKLRASQWDGVVVETARVLEAVFTQQLEEEKKRRPDKWSQMLEKCPEMEKPLDRWSAGTLSKALDKLHIVKQDTFEGALVGELVSIRNRIHPKRTTFDFDSRWAQKCDMYLEVFLRLWYGLSS